MNSASCRARDFLNCWERLQIEPLMDHVAELATPAEHPCYAGHFPGNPVVPGVLLLELLTEAFGRGAPRAVSSVKFHRALAPADRCIVRWKNRGTSLRFRCEHGTVLVADGSLEYGRPDE